MIKNEMDENVKHLVFGVCIAFVMLGAFAGAGVALVSATIIPDNYTKIQWAVDNSSAGDTIIVRDETYTENIGVNRNPRDSVSSSPKDYKKKIMHDFLTGKSIVSRKQRTMSHQKILSPCQNLLLLLNKTYSSIKKDFPLMIINPCLLEYVLVISALMAGELALTRVRLPI